MERKLDTFEWWEIHSAAIGILGAPAVAQALGTKLDYAYKCAQQFSDWTGRDAGSRIERLCNQLVTTGGDDGRELARIIYQRIAGATKCGASAAIIPNAPTVEAECLDDYPALQAFHEAVLAGEHQLVINTRMDDAIRELRETAAKAKEGR